MTIDVNSEADVVADDGQCTVREAVIAANTNAVSGAKPNECQAGSGSDTIELPAGQYDRTIDAATTDTPAVGDLDVLEDLTIHGAGVGKTEIDAFRKDRVIEIASGVTVTIDGVGITGGRAASGDDGSDATTTGGDAGAGGDGGGILNAGTLTLVDSNVSVNFAGDGGNGGIGGGTAGTSVTQTGGPGSGGKAGDGGRGGGIFNSGRLIITRTGIAYNSGGQGGVGGTGGAGPGYAGMGATGAGGGAGSGLSGGKGGSGGGIFSSGSGEVTITGSTLANNTAGRGGTGGAGEGGAGGSNETASGDKSGGAGGTGLGGPGGDGGGISLEGPLTLTASLVTANTTGRGGDGGVGIGGTGGVGDPAAGAGGTGGVATGGSGGNGGQGGGLFHAGTGTLTNVTVDDNHTAAGSVGGAATGGQGGTGASGGTGGAGGAGTGGAGGSGGDGGGIAGQTLTLRQGTITDSETAAGAAGGAGTGGSAGSADMGTPGTAGTGTAGTAGGTGQGGGIMSLGQASATSSLLAGNQPANCAGTVNDGGFNLDFPDGPCPGIAAPPGLGALYINGGPTYTRSITETSPAHDAVPAGPACAATDQRGVTRPQGAACDIGAFELEYVAPPPVPDTVAPVISKVGLTNTVFAIAKPATAGAKRKPPKRGTTFRYTLSEDARVAFTVRRRTVGRKVGGSCRKRTRKNRKRRKCVRYVYVGGFSQAGKTGANARAFTGRIGRKALKPARYRARLEASDTAGNYSKAKLLTFRVVKRR